jgi:amidophosphoribosyltransferase
MVSEIAERLHLDSLKFAKLETLVRAIGLPKERICTHCFDGSSFYTLEQANLEDLRLDLTCSNDLSGK